MVIFVGGDAPQYNNISWVPNCIIAVDSGLLVCKNWKIIPDVVIGDFDTTSIEESKLYAPKSKIINFDTNKNCSDSFLALEYAYKNNYRDITMVGGVGQRLDHFIALLTLFSHRYAPNRIIGPQYQLERFFEIHRVDCRNISDKYISFFSLGKITRQNTQGLRWDLTDIILSSEYNSLSNEYVDECVTISMQEGELLGVWAHGNTPQQTIQ